MTLSEIESTLPNGFHDCWIHSIELDFKNHRAVFGIEVDFGDSEKLVRVELTGLRMFVMDPPDGWESLHLFDRLEACGHAPEEGLFEQYEEFKRTAPPEAFVYTFWLRQLNAKIHVSALDARLVTS